MKQKSKPFERFQLLMKPLYFYVPLLGACCSNESVCHLSSSFFYLLGVIIANDAKVSRQEEYKEDSFCGLDDY